MTPAIQAVGVRRCAVTEKSGRVVSVDFTVYRKITHCCPCFLSIREACRFFGLSFSADH